MIPALTAAVAVIAVIVLVDFALALAIIRRLRMQGPIARPDIGLPDPGTHVPSFSETSIEGQAIDSEWVAEQPAVVLGFFAPSCPACSRLKDELRERPLDDPFVAFLRRAEAHEVVDAELGDVLADLGQVVEFEASSQFPRRFAVGGFPTLVRYEYGTVTAVGHGLRALAKSHSRSRPTHDRAHAASVS